MKINRRKAITQLGIGSGMAMLPNIACSEPAKTPEMPKKRSLKGNINHSVSRWCFNDIPLEEFCEICKDIGIKSIELTTAEEWPILAKYGLTCAMATHNASLTEGFNNPDLHQKLYQPHIDMIDAAAEAGLKNVICFSGNRNGMDDTVGMENCAKGLDKIVKHAASKGITVAMELFNQEDHPDYMCDSTEWSVKLVDKIGSDHFKILYDIYHMQVQEGNIIATIKKYHKYFSHYHTAGVPGRNEINDSQELNYSPIMKAIVETGFTGFVGQEFIPTYEDKVAALREGIMICDV